MKKVVIVVTICIIFLVCNFCMYKIVISDNNKIEYDEEKYGLLYGRDYIAHVGDGMYQISRFYFDEYATDILTIADSTGSIYEIFKFTFSFFFENGVLYYRSADGYAIVYPESNLCKALIIAPDLEFIKNQEGRSADNNYLNSQLDPECCDTAKNVIYLDSFDEFTKYEQKRLKKLGTQPIELERCLSFR